MAAPAVIDWYPKAGKSGSLTVNLTDLGCGFLRACKRCFRNRPSQPLGGNCPFTQPQAALASFNTAIGHWSKAVLKEASSLIPAPAT